MKIGILTYHRARNYGAFLQAVCLCSRLNQEEGITAEIIDYDMQAAQDYYSLKHIPFRNRLLHPASYRFHKKQITAFHRGIDQLGNLKSEASLISDDLDRFSAFVDGRYDVIISGSDEIWRIKEFRGFPNPYFLPGELHTRKFSYAASARMDFGVLSPELHAMVRDCLKDYEFISVRDKLTYVSMKSEGIPREKMMVSCDPSFLYDFPNDDRTVQELLKGKCRPDPQKGVLVLAGISKPVAAGILAQLGGTYNIISTFNRLPGCINLADLDPFEWRALISKADFVITSLFHGVCFSIVGQTPFAAVATEVKKSKLQELLFATELEKNYIDADKARSVDWKAFCERARENADTRAFVLNQRNGFDRFMKALRGEKVEEEVAKRFICPDDHHPITYAVRHQSETVRETSRSGGMFSALTDYVLDQNGVVYGCAMDENLHAVHIRAVTKAERDGMRGSKYVQSRMGDCFRRVKQDLTEGLTVLFSGTPCQVDGLKKFLGQEYENLFLVDILCHGVPGEKVLDRYIHWMEQRHGKCTGLDFRNKKVFGWASHVETLSFEKKEIHSRVFSKIFYRHLSLRPSCYECPYKTEWHPSHITLGDFWAIDQVCPAFNDNRGVSLVFINDEKGKQLFDAVKKDLTFVETSYEYSVKESMFRPAQRPDDRAEFWTELDEKDFGRIAKKYGGNSLKNRMKQILKKLLGKT